MSLEDFEVYWDLISVIEAKETLLSIRVHDWPTTKNTKRKEMHRELHREATRYIEKESVSVDDFVRSFGGVKQDRLRAERKNRKSPSAGDKGKS